MTPRPGAHARRGFTLLEALVALALVLAFAGALGPYLFQARRIVDKAGGRVAAHVLLRSLLDAPFDRENAPPAARDGETSGLRWRVAAQPLFVIKRTPAAAGQPAADAANTNQASGNAAAAQRLGQQAAEPDWIAYKLTASVSWAPGELLSAETLRLGKAH